MGRAAGIAGGVLLGLLLLGIFVATQIEGSDGRTLADRVPVVGEVVRWVGLGTPGGDAPVLQVVDERRALVEGTSCETYLKSSAEGRLAVTDAFVELAADDGDPLAKRVDRTRLAEAIGLACQRAGSAASVDAAIRDTTAAR
jgi:hypothetical protein